MGLLNALSIGLGTMLGAGIFVLSGTLGLIVVWRASPDWYQPSFRVPFSS